MFHWLCLAWMVTSSAEGLAVLQSAFVKKILQQDPAFCFRPLNTSLCNDKIFQDVFSNQTADIFDPSRKTLAFLFTPLSPRHPEFLHKCDYGLPNNTLFDPKLKTEIFIHGFLDGVCRSAWMREMKRELFKRGPYNVILVDWTWGNGPNYIDSAENTKLVGKQLAFLLQNIMERGHGKIIQSVVLGDINPLGHVDFYPNGGTQQDSCRPHIVKSFFSLDFLYATISLIPRICSHLHAVQYYKASINPSKCEFIGVECPDYESFLAGNCSSCQKNGQNCAIMGMNHEFYYRPSNSPLPLFRRFYLNTTHLHPYCDNSILNLE
ncbi:Phospholipase A1 member A like protein [Argiope bruennichi]|uniref:Phospholipase A1 member A like protein n=1 Tax=Argiope bruennichi TaxID=94029 RepID=A0A8T0FNJ0_ARGBR|nr:Phospholipase A1 member A like protein [Argiope bruennichi]